MTEWICYLSVMRSDAELRARDAASGWAYLSVAFAVGRGWW